MERQNGSHPSVGESDPGGDGQPIDDTGVSLVGATFAGKYLIEAVVGVGGMAHVYKARQQVLDREVAVKVLHPPEGGDLERAAFERMFLQEAGAAAGLKSPNSITIYDFGQTDDTTLYLVMEYLEGRTLQEIVDGDEPLPAARAVHVAVQVCRSLREAHEKGLVHRDLKPANVMLVDRNNDPDFVKVLDFGIVKNQDELGEGDDASLLGRFVGSPRYASPEQLQRRPDVDHRADIYALGLLLYTMLAGAPPFDGTPRELLHKHLLEPPRPIDEQTLGISEELAAVVYRCLEKDPAKRFADMTDLIRALGQISFEGSGGEPAITNADLAEFAREIELDETDDALVSLRAEEARRRHIAALTAPDPDDETTDEFVPVGGAADAEPSGSSPVRRPVWPWVVAGLALIAVLAALGVGLGPRLLGSTDRDGADAAPPATAETPVGPTRTPGPDGPATSPTAGAGGSDSVAGGQTGAGGETPEIEVEDAPEGTMESGAGVTAAGTGGPASAETSRVPPPIPDPTSDPGVTAGAGEPPPETHGGGSGEEPTPTAETGSEGATGEGDDPAPQVEGYKDDPY